MKSVLVAVPGSGKTTYIAGVISRMIAEGTDPDRIYAITFTREAAGEMKGKIGNNNVKVSTLHSLAYSIYMGTDLVNEDPPEDTFYDHLVTNATDILMRKDYIFNIDMIALDEAQDISRIQYLFLLELTKRAEHILIVGDPLQSIFGFMKGSPEYMYKFVEEAECSIVDTELHKSYRLPSSITEMVNKVFPGIEMEHSGEKGGAEIVKMQRKSIIPAIKGYATDREGTTGILFRTNKEISGFVKTAMDRTQYNYTISLSEHPIVSLVSTLLTLHTGIEPQSLYTTSEFLGYGGWEAKQNMVALKQMYLAGEVLTIDKLQDLYGAGDLYMKKDTPLIVPRVRRATRAVIDTLKYLSTDIDSLKNIQEGIDTAIENINIAGYNIDNTWDIPVDIIKQAIKRKVLTHKDLYYYIDNKANKTVSTIHSSKGKEFDNVITVVNTYVDLSDQEEFRIMYVAMTRARRSLVVILPEEGIENKMRDKLTIIDAMLRTIGII